jgi:hypothetical protein
MYKVIVGNIGCVYSGWNEKDALKTFSEYKKQSINNYGRASGEDVAMLFNDEIVKQFDGKLSKNTI